MVIGVRSTRESRAAFAARLEALRIERGVTQRWIADELAERGHDVRPQAISGWERAAFAPDRSKAHALDDLLNAKGVLLAALGFTEPDDAGEPVRRLLAPVYPGEMERRMSELEQKLTDLEAELGTERQERREADRRLSLVISGAHDPVLPADVAARLPVELATLPGLTVEEATAFARLATDDEIDAHAEERRHITDEGVLEDIREFIRIRSGEARGRRAG